MVIAPNIWSIIGHITKPDILASILKKLGSSGLSGLLFLVRVYTDKISVRVEQGFEEPRIPGFGCRISGYSRIRKPEALPPDNAYQCIFHKNGIFSSFDPLTPRILEPLNPIANNRKRPVDYGIIRKSTYIPHKPNIKIDNTILEDPNPMRYLHQYLIHSM